MTLPCLPTIIQDSFIPQKSIVSQLATKLGLTGGISQNKFYQPRQDIFFVWKPPSIVRNDQLTSPLNFLDE